MPAGSGTSKASITNTGGSEMTRMEIRAGDVVIVEPGEPPAMVVRVRPAFYRHGGGAGHYLDIVDAYGPSEVWTQMFPDIEVVQ
jgi:hypothetical protein